MEMVQKLLNDAMKKIDAQLLQLQQKQLQQNSNGGGGGSVQKTLVQTAEEKARREAAKEIIRVALGGAPGPGPTPMKKQHVQLS